MKLTKEQKNFIEGKIRKVKGLSDVVKQQREFIEQVNLTLMFLQAYEGNPDSFPLIIGDDIWDFYKFEECYNANNPEYMWECIDEMTCDMVYKNKHFKITGNGIFSVLHFSNTPNRKFKESFEFFKQYGKGGEWHI